MSSSTGPVTTTALAPGPAGDAHPEPGPWLLRLAALLIGIVAAILGVAPWLSHGGRLPSQNLGISYDPTAFSLLPLSQYTLSEIPGILVAGAVFAGIAVRAMRSRWAVPSLPAWLGLALVQLVMVMQSGAALVHELGLDVGGADPRAALFATGVLGGTVGCLLLAQAAFWLVSRRSVSATALGLVLSAVPVGGWLGQWSPVGPFAPNVVTQLFSQLSSWAPVALVGLALGWCGVRPLGRIVVWIVGLGAIWVVPALQAGLITALGSRALYRDPREIIAVAQEVFVAAFGLGIGQVVTAAALGIAVLVLRTLASRSPRSDRAPAVGM